MASRILGIDLGAYSVKVAVVNPGFRHAAIADFIELPVPPGDEPHEVRAARALGQIVRDARLAAEPAFAAVSGDELFVHVLDFPFKHVKRADLTRAVGTELEGLLPIELEEMVYAYEILPREAGAEAAAPRGPGEGAGSGDDDPTFVRSMAPEPPGRVAPPAEGMRVLACAMRRDRARRMLDLLGAEDAEPRGLLAAPAAYVRVAERITACQESRAAGLCAAVVDVGHEHTNVCVVTGGRADYVRTIARGGRDLTEAIARAWNMPFDQAESAKHQEGFIGSSARPPASSAWERISSVLSGELGPLARDLRQTFAACRAKTGVAVGRVVLVGGGSRLSGLPEFLSEELRVPVVLPAPEDVERILGSRLSASGAPVELACLAAGVAFEGAGGRPQFDLRQGDLAYKADLSFLRAKAPQLGVAALAIIGFAAISGWANFYKLRKAERTLDERVALESAAAFGEPLAADDVLERIQPTGGSAASPIPAMTGYDLLLAFNAAIPDKKQVKIDVRELEIEPGRMIVRATAFPLGQDRAQEAISTFTEALKGSPCFKDFDSPESQPGTDDNTRDFSLSIRVNCKENQ